MAFARIYTGDDGLTHFEDLEPLKVGATERSRSAPLPAGELHFLYMPDGEFHNWHNSIARDYLVIMSGQMEFQVGDGSKRRFGAGDACLSEDLTGGGHTSGAVGDTLFALVRLPSEGQS